MNKQLLILPEGKRFNKPQTKELNEAGFVVVYLPDPSQARIIHPEQQPIPANAMLLAAMKVIRKADTTYVYRDFMDSLLVAAQPDPASGKQP